ncbi:MAG: penicillin-binding protein [Pseudonocardia sp.]|nr:penicillin-binding protein [Pseudonocardia sp.]
MIRRHPAARLVACTVLAGVLLATALLVPLGALRYAVGGVRLAELPTGVLSRGGPALASTLVDAQGRPFARVGDQYRVPVQADGIAAAVRTAVVAAEDRRFFSHHGVDWQGVGRALVHNLATTGAPFQGQGASTITMQYAKLYRLYVLADSDAERQAAVADTLTRKLRDIRFAVRLETRLSKQEILTKYLNIAYFGNGAYGIEAAARTYFGTGADELTLPRAALLAGLVRSPATYDPVDHPRAARARRATVLDSMAGAGSITPARAASAKAAPLGIRDPLGRTASGCAAADDATGFFCNYVLDHLAAAGLSRADLRTGGYTIRTTLDRSAARPADRAAERLVPTSRTDGIANVIAIVEPGGDRHPVRALAANLDYGPDAAQGETARPVVSAPVPFGAGSVWKIFTAAVALQRGVDLDTVLPVPESYTSDVYTDAGAPYTVGNVGDYPSSLTLREALAQSPNTTFVALEDRIGSIDPIVDMAYRLGMRTSLGVRDARGRTIAEAVTAEQRGSFTLGPQPTSPLELANVAATLTSDGMWCPATPIVSVTDRRGDPVPTDEAPCERAVPAGLAHTLVAGLSEDAVSGTAAAAADAAGWTRPMLGKTGTTQDNVSSAFVGATPQYAGAAMTWSDATPPEPVCTDPARLCSDGDLFGGTIPARTWYAAMSPLHEGLPVVPLPGPAAHHLGSTG